MGEHFEMPRDADSFFEPRDIGVSNNFNAVIKKKNNKKSEVLHLDELSESFAEIFRSSDHSDVTLVLDDGAEFPTHKLILATRSTFFKALLFNGFQETHQARVALHETNSQAFREILQYMYTSKIDLKEVELEVLLDYLSLAHRYDLGQLMTSISEYFKEILKNENLCSILNAAYFFQFTDLIEFCMEYSDKYADQLLDDPSFTTLTGNSLKELLERDSFYAKELKIFMAVRAWTEKNRTMKKASKELMELVRLPLISQNELLSEVRPTGLVEADALLDAIEKQTQKPEEIQYRGCKTLDINICSSFSPLPPYTRESSFIYAIEEDLGVFTIDLGKPFIINTILIELSWKSEVNAFSYSVCIGMHNTSDSKWQMISDYMKFDCRGNQKVFMKDTVVRYILIKVTNPTSFRLDASRIEAMYSTETMPVDPTTFCIVPTRNITTVENHARVVEGVSRCRNALINGDKTSYDWDSGYTCHQIGSGLIMIQLAQPYIISSMRILLWNCDDRFYSFYIAVSTNQIDWITVVDKTNDECRGWQELFFDPLPVVYIRLVGTRNSINEVFHVVHLEAPSSVPIPIK